MRRIAVYGKGGIGKSTISANLSAALALGGRRVVQVGCDPKHDSTRQLLGGARITTVLDYLRDTRPDRYELDAVLHEGFADVGCVEAGGPKPGVGCAGRGIISTFDLLAQFRLEERYDTAVYDVLGDVVCGGFAVPIRREYADTVLVVTSGEFMSLYAANNILRGIRNYDGDDEARGRVAGIVFNRRNVADEEERVLRFARAVRLPVIADIPRSDSFARAERAHATVVQLREDEALCALFEDLAGRLAHGMPLHVARPLGDEELEAAVLGNAAAEGAGASWSAESGSSAGAGTGACADLGADADADSGADDGADAYCAENTAGIRTHAPADAPARQDPDTADGRCTAAGIASERASEQSVEAESAADDAAQDSPAFTAHTLWEDPDLTNPNRYLSKTLVSGEPLHGCAFNGAIAAALQVRDAVVVAHAPRSCANLSLAAFTSTGRRVLFERGALMPTSLVPNLECTDMDEPQIVFGGTDALLRKVRQVKAREPQPRAVVVVSSCPAGIIGDDLDRVSELSDRDCTVLPLKTDGNMTGDFQQGHIAAHLAVARTFIDRGVQPRPRVANIFAEKPVVTNTQRNFELISGFLAQMGVSVNCRFLNSTSVDELRGFCAAELNIPAYGDYTAQLLGRLIRDEFGGRVLDRGFPIGHDETLAWLQEVAEVFGAQEAVPGIVGQQQALYDRAIDELRPQLAGRKLMVVTYNCELDWILKTALDLEMEVVRIGVLNYSQDAGFRTRLDADFPVVEDYDRFARGEEIEQLAPDVLLTNYASAFGDSVPVADTIPMCPDAGFLSSVNLARRWARLLKLKLKGGWKHDGTLFEEAFL